MRLIFMGTPEFAVPTLSEIVGQGHEVVAVYTRAPAQGGRGMDLRPSPVHVMAQRFGLPVLTPASLKGDAEADVFASFGADAAVVVAYGLLLPQRILDAPALGCLNLHGSLLPRWRGAAPIQRAVMAGDSMTGVMVMRMEAGLDTGPVGMAETLPIGPDMTAGDLHDHMAPIGADLMGRAVGALGRGSLQFKAQSPDGVTYARKIDKAECRIDWDHPAQVVHDTIRGLSPFPGAFFEADLGSGTERVKVLRARVSDGSGPAGTLIAGGLTVACAAGAVTLLQVQRAGKAPLDTDTFLRGTRLAPGLRLAPSSPS
ncbi:methionyl-tRNA formyltransferase [Lichenihabitans psoromatis]|uniref:methionyl-tRNA formyltransferase n=1 Tax=Lichenihabitans psoromatis TaxID=2528642 RepID=UPI001038406E|nr:methionyl-tRNA formyltransferase [Lichenihabitans psoromatis]